MTIEQQLECLSRQTCPKQVDVVDSVMDVVSKKPYLQPVHRSNKRQVWRIVATTAAAAVVALIVNVTMLYTHSYDDEGLGLMMAQVNDYSSYSVMGTVEDAAIDPLEYVYGY